LLVSAWSRRAPLLWAVLPIVAITAVEKIVFHAMNFAVLVVGRWFGDVPTVADMGKNVFPTNPMTHMMPGMFLSNPSLWIGLVVAAVFLTATVQVRRSRGPM